MSILMAIFGTFILQDALASIAFYPEEKWCWNHIARLTRAVIGAILIVMGVLDG